MKFTRRTSCEMCNSGCDIWRAALEAGKADQYEPLCAEYKKHEIICKQGSPVTHSIFLIDGYAKLYIEGLNNRNIILYILTSNSYIGLLSFFESVNYSYSVTALGDCKVCMVDLEFVKKLYYENPNLLINLNKAFGKSVAAILSKIISLNQKQIRGRVAESLLYLSKLHNSDTFNLGITRKELGEMSAISEENTVRILTEFRQEEIIRLNGKDVEINDISLLKKISEVG